jgi:hypothetical protein
MAIHESAATVMRSGQSTASGSPKNRWTSMRTQSAIVRFMSELAAALPSARSHRGAGVSQSCSRVPSSC